MSSAIVLPDLQNFVQQRITALYTAPSAEAFAEAFDSFVGQHAHITVNGRKTSRAAYQKLLLGEVNGDLSATVTFGDVVAVPADPEGQDLNKIGTGTVGAFFRANIVGRIIVLGSRESKTVTSSFNVTVEKDTSLSPPIIGHGGAFDARRATLINDVLTNVENPIKLPTGTTTSA